MPQSVPQPGSSEEPLREALSHEQFAIAEREFVAKLGRGDVTGAREDQQRLLVMLGDVVSAQEALAASDRDYELAVREERARAHLSLRDRRHEMIQRTEVSVLHRAHRLTEADLHLMAWPRSQGSASAHLWRMAAEMPGRGRELRSAMAQQRVASLNSFRADLAVMMSNLEMGATEQAMGVVGGRADLYMRAATTGVLLDLEEEFRGSPAWAGPVAISHANYNSGPRIEVGVRFAARHHGVPTTLTVYYPDPKDARVGARSSLERRLGVGRNALKALEIKGASKAPLIQRRDSVIDDFRGSEEGLPEGDLDAMLGATPDMPRCGHVGGDRLQWHLNDTHDAMCLDCRICRRRSLVAVPLHRVRDHEKLSDETSYLGLQAYYQELAGDDRPIVSMAQLLERDGPVSLEEVARTRKVPTAGGDVWPPRPVSIKQAFNRR